MVSESMSMLAPKMLTPRTDVELAVWTVRLPTMRVLAAMASR